LDYTGVRDLVLWVGGRLAGDGIQPRGGRIRIPASPTSLSADRAAGLSILTTVPPSFSTFTAARARAIRRHDRLAWNPTIKGVATGRCSSGRSRCHFEMAIDAPNMSLAAAAGRLRVEAELTFQQEFLAEVA